MRIHTTSKESFHRLPKYYHVSWLRSCKTNPRQGSETRIALFVSRNAPKRFRFSMLYTTHPGQKYQHRKRHVTDAVPQDGTLPQEPQPPAPASKGNSALHSFRRHANLLLYAFLKYPEGLQYQSHQQNSPSNRPIKGISAVFILVVVQVNKRTSVQQSFKSRERVG